MLHFCKFLSFFFTKLYNNIIIHPLRLADLIGGFYGNRPEYERSLEIQSLLHG